MHRRFAATRGAVAIAVVACSACGGGGAGPTATTMAGGRDEPGTTRDTPPPTRDGTTGACIACDTLYRCSGGSSQMPGSIELRTRDGTCTQGLVDYVCSGALFGATSCTGGGGGYFTCGAVSCVAQATGR